MKEALTSLLRHALTALAGIGALLAARGCIAEEDAAAVDAAGLSIGEGLIVVVVAIVARLTISWMGKLTAPKSGGSSASLVCMMTAGTLPLLFVAGSLMVVGCADYQGPRFVVGVDHEQGRVEYDSAKGGTVRVDAKLPRVQGNK